jgi:hypothetical protein
MAVTYLTDYHEIEEVKHDEDFESRQGRTVDGYTTKSGAPIGTMIRLKGSKRWRRVMLWQFSNMGTCFVKIKEVPHIVRDYEIQEAV